MKRVLLVFLLISFLFPVSVAADAGLSIIIEDVTINPSSMVSEGNRTGFLVNATITVSNPTNTEISFTHADLCRFKLKIESTNSAVSNYYPYSCAEALEMVKFQPGNTTSSAIGGFLIDAGLENLPNGNYSVFVDLQDFQLDVVEANYGVSFDVVDNQVVENYNSVVRFQNSDLMTAPSGTLPVEFLPLLFGLLVIAGWRKFH